jgi:hypothetical protein
LYVWHTVFGYCGTLNVISIWDCSLLLQVMCDSFDEIGFLFTIGGKQFQQLWLLVDGMYPPLLSFVKANIGDMEVILIMAGIKMERCWVFLQSF